MVRFFNVNTRTARPAPQNGGAAKRSPSHQLRWRSPLLSLLQHNRLLTFTPIMSSFFPEISRSPPWSHSLTLRIDMLGRQIASSRYVARRRSRSCGFAGSPAISSRNCEHIQFQSSHQGARERSGINRRIGATPQIASFGSARCRPSPGRASRPPPGRGAAQHRPKGAPAAAAVFQSR